MSNTRGRRTKPTSVEDTTPVVGSTLGAPPLLAGAGLLEHGLDSGDDLYVWVNKTNPSDISSKLRAGFVLVKMGDVRKPLEANGIPSSFYQEDEAGNVCYGVDLILMRGSKSYQIKKIREAIFDQAGLVSDASVSEMRHRLDDALSTTNLKRDVRP